MVKCMNVILHHQLNQQKIIKMKQVKTIDFIEKLNANEMSNLKGGFSHIENVDNKTEVDSSENSQVIIINGRPYRIEKDGSIRPL